MRAMIIVGALGVAASAWGDAPQVYLNEVKIDAGSVKGTTMRSVDVTFDERGDVHITARGYKVTSESTAPEPPLGGRHYYIATAPQRRNGAAQWELDVFINQVFVHKFRSKLPDPFVEVTRFLKPGMNTVKLLWHKEAGIRVSSAREDAFEVRIGTGDLIGGALQLSAIATFKHSAAETGEFTTDASLEVPAK